MDIARLAVTKGWLRPTYLEISGNYMCAYAGHSFHVSATHEWRWSDDPLTSKIAYMEAAVVSMTLKF